MDDDMVVAKIGDDFLNRSWTARYVWEVKSVDTQVPRSINKWSRVWYNEFQWSGCGTMLLCT